MSNILISFFEVIEKIEDRFMKKGNLKGFLLSKISSLLSIGLIIYLLTFMIPIIIYMFFGQQSNLKLNMQHLWAISFLIFMPFIVVFSCNFKDKDFRFSKKCIEFINVIKISKVDIGSTRFIFEIFAFFTYVFVNLYLTLCTLNIFLNDSILKKYLERNSNTLASIICFIHAYIYLILRVFLIPGNTVEQKLTKAKREFRIWLLTLIISFAYIIYRLYTNLTLLDFMYFILSLLVSTSRAINSYNNLILCAEKVKEQPALVVSNINLFHLNKKKVYKEFYCYEEANDWGLKHYSLWNRDIRLKNNDIYKLFYDYTGGMNTIYNRFLRGYENFTEEEVKEYSRDIDIIANEICKFELKENIIVYRYTSNALFKLLFDSQKPKIGQVFVDKGFMSTTLVRNQLKDFAKTHHYNCLLKLYLPVGTKGVYIEFDDSLLNECEFLLPPNSKFRLLRKYWNLSFQRVYECELINQ